MLLLLLLSWIMVGCVYILSTNTKKKKKTMHVKNLLVLL
jgi:hypothetical protein